MWPYIIRVNTKAFLAMTMALATLFVFWYYILLGSRDSLEGLIESDVDLKQLLIGMSCFHRVGLNRSIIACVVASTRGGQQVVRVRQENQLMQQSKGKTKEGVDDVLTQGDLFSHQAMVHPLSAAFPGLRVISEEHSAEDDAIDVIPIHLTDEMLRDPQYSQVPDGVRVPLGQLDVWVDPLDATKEYSEGLTQYVTTMVCVARNGVPIIGVIHKPFSHSPQTYWSFDSKYLSKNIISALSGRNSSNHSLRAIISRSHAGDVESKIRTGLSGLYKNIEVISAAGSGFKTIQMIEDKADVYVHMTLIKKWDICAPNAILNSIASARMTTLGGQAINYHYDKPVNNEDGLLASMNQDHQQLVQLLAHNSL